MASKIGIDCRAKLHAYLVYKGKPLTYRAFAMKLVIKVCCTKMFLCHLDILLNKDIYTFFFLDLAGKTIL